MIDLWNRLHPLFDEVEGEQLEIVIVNLSPAAMQAVLRYMMVNASQLTTGFTDLYDREVQPPSIDFTVENVTSGRLLGMLAMNLMIEGYRLPYMGYIIQDTDFLAIAYEMGWQWTPTALIALFEFFRMVKDYDAEALIALNPYMFTKVARVQFEATLREYLAEKADA